MHCASHYYVYFYYNLSLMWWANSSQAPQRQGSILIASSNTSLAWSISNVFFSTIPYKYIVYPSSSWKEKDN